MPKQQKPSKRDRDELTTKKQESAELQVICPECPTTHKRQQAKQKRLAAEMASQQLNEISRGSLLPGPENHVRANAHCLFPRNNLIDGMAHQERLNSPGGKPITPVNQESRNVRINQLETMRRKAAFAQEQQDFVGKLTSQQQAVKIHSANADQINHMATVQQTAYGPIAQAPANRVGSSNIAFRKKKASSVMKQLPPLNSKTQ